MKCPQCNATKNIKFFLRHQDTEEDLDNEANVITILCTECGNNESFFLIDCLPNIFPNWDENKFTNFDFNILGW